MDGSLFFQAIFYDGLFTADYIKRYTTYVKSINIGCYYLRDSSVCAFLSKQGNISFNHISFTISKALASYSSHIYTINGYNELIKLTVNAIIAKQIFKSTWMLRLVLTVC